MFIKMLKKDIGKNKGINMTLFLFITLAAMLAAGACGIVAEIISSTDAFFEKSKPLHYMQMVTGEVDQKAINAFSEAHELVKEQQTLALLGIDNNYIYYGDNPEPYSGSNMENLFVPQSPKFDFLLDENNSVIKVEPGQIAAPIYAIDAYGLKKGDLIYIKRGNFEMQFTVIDFARDSQMNASLISSKRFLVNEKDYDRLRANIGEVEYIIEFLLTDPAKTGAFETDYLAAGLPSGIAITLPIIQMMNGMTVGLSVAVLVLASVMLIVIALVCLRFTVLTTLEEEYREIGVMKAIGLPPRLIAKLYKLKYYFLGTGACALGFLLSLAFSPLFTEGVALYMGKAEGSLLVFFLPMFGSLLVFAIIVGYCSSVFKKMRKISVVEAIRGTNAKRSGKAFSIHKLHFGNINLSLGARDVFNRLRDYKTPIIVFTLCVFLIIVPMNFLNTLNAPSFIGYTGVGDCDALITLRYSGDIQERYNTVLSTLSADTDVAAYSERVTANYKTINPDGAYVNVSIQNGDFTKFPLPYAKGRAPVTDGEIALSLLNTREFIKNVGDNMEVMIDGMTYKLTVCGIYQDLTNGGKSAQANLPYKQENVLWYAVSLKFTEDADTILKIDAYNELFAPAKVISIERYQSETLASTVGEFENMTMVAFAVSIAVAILITALYIKMILSKDKGQITIMKGLGFNSSHIQSQYITALVLCLIIGTVFGTVAANTLGEGLIGLIMSAIGVSKISFVINPVFSFIICPAALLTAVILTILLSARAIQKCGNYIISE